MQRYHQNWIFPGPPKVVSGTKCVLGHMQKAVSAAVLFAYLFAVQCYSFHYIYKRPFKFRATYILLEFPNALNKKNLSGYRLQMYSQTQTFRDCFGRSFKSTIHVHNYICAVQVYSTINPPWNLIYLWQSKTWYINDNIYTANTVNVSHKLSSRLRECFQLKYFTWCNVQLSLPIHASCS